MQCVIILAGYRCRCYLGRPQPVRDYCLGRPKCSSHRRMSILRLEMLGGDILHCVKHMGYFRCPIQHGKLAAVHSVSVYITRLINTPAQAKTRPLKRSSMCKSTTQAVPLRMQTTLHAPHRTHPGASRLVQAIPTWCQ